MLLVRPCTALQPEESGGAPGSRRKQRACPGRPGARPHRPRGSTAGSLRSRTQNDSTAHRMFGSATVNPARTTHTRGRERTDGKKGDPALGDGGRGGRKRRRGRECQRPREGKVFTGLALTGTHQHGRAAAPSTLPPGKPARRHAGKVGLLEIACGSGLSPGGPDTLPVPLVCVTPVSHLRRVTCPAPTAPSAAHEAAAARPGPPSAGPSHCARLPDTEPSP